LITTKSALLNRLFRTPFTTSVVATTVSLIFAAAINFIFLAPRNLPMTLAVTLVISAPMSYLTIKIVITMRSTIEYQKVKLALERERAEILSKFIRDAAHEFKTPLTIMTSNLYLAEKTTDPEKKQAYTENTNNQIQILNKLLDNILILTRLDSTEQARYPLQSLTAAELLTDIQSFSRSERVKIVSDVKNNNQQLKVNRSDLHLAIEHMLGNALRYSPETSDVTLQIIPSGQWLIIQVTDQGQGMTTETIQHIFDRFYRMDESHTSRGLGLGLAITKRVFELHDGHIEVQSEIGKGTTIKALLPISRS
jgi:signal transduction histidine kinase